MALRLAVDFVLPPAPDLTRLDAWLNGVLQLDLAPPAAAGSRTPEQIQVATARAWLQRALRLARLLWQVARVPVFDLPAIIGCRPDQARPGGWQAQVSLARIDEMPYAVYDIAVSGALGLIAWAAERDVDAAHLDNFYDLIEQRVSARLRPLWPLWPQAKSTLPVLRVAHQMSIPFSHLGAGSFQLGWGQRAQRIDRSVTGRDPFIAATVCANKAMTAKWLRQAGLPAPVHKVVKGLPAALKAAAEIGWPVVCQTDRRRAR